MSNKELEYYRILSLIQNKQLSQLKRAELLVLSTQQVCNLLKELKTKGPKGLVSKRRGTVSFETLRFWMTEAHIWIPKQRKRNKHPLRKRKECFRELIQMDGSHHDWLEGRSSPY